MTKVKLPPEDRIYDVDGYWLRAACVCVKDHSETEVRQRQVCLRLFRSKLVRTSFQWGFPVKIPHLEALKNESVAYMTSFKDDCNPRKPFQTFVCCF